MTESHVERARRLYNIAQWSDGYLAIGDAGEVRIRPHRNSNDLSVSLPDLARRLQNEGVRLPVLVRFSDILHDRVNRLCTAFNRAAQKTHYQGHYAAVYPIKVNQQRHVVEEIVRAEPAAKHGQVGLEAGSKPELLAVMAMAPATGTLIICNGYKDREYIHLALIGQKLGHRVFIVVEKPSELPLILEQADALGVEPLIGVRARLATISQGNWQNTGGEKSKFGLSASQVMAMIDALKGENRLSSLQMLHFHLGSQIANIRDIQTGLRECARFYTELRAMGVPVSTVDIGGGLGIDYEGTGSRSACSMNYSMDEYAANVIHILQTACDQQNLPHPDLISESGRALTAHHAVLITNVVDREASDDAEPAPAGERDPTPVQELTRSLSRLTETGRQRSLVELYHDVLHAMDDVQAGFVHGTLTLAERARSEELYRACCQALARQLDPGNRAQRDLLDELNEKLADRLFVNFSLFQSLPDVWGIDQIFPVLPITGLDRPLTRRALIRDMTCDSDGRMDRYVEDQNIESTLPLPADTPGEPMLLGFFLVGAYQEILGDMHNLFGDTSSVDVSCPAEGDWEVRHLAAGDTVADVLRYVNFDPEVLLDRYRHRLEASTLSDLERRTLFDTVRKGLGAYTYLAPDM
ncbi:arginine decarboxylase [Tamilnaduibacter salinus]|uniref:Biosynthetic arginine decarboxylase n=1 Tax=Tamilnaduibacter salinus TaxID=1484056 RepID=A0A2U1CXL1_9GAMM|nr:biosynthetic arginine decarboxylase [Tamilnaduibacter salinus]PVY76955.1 arginine decarboxylase [Tamilnaduibacter salinus]